MSAFAVTLDRLLSHLDHLESETASPRASRSAPSAHVERATIRLRRAYAALQDAGPRAPVELFIRLKGRAQEVEQALVDSAPPNNHPQLAPLATQVVQQIEQHIAVPITVPDSDSDSGGGHSRTPSTSDLPRRVPSSSSKSTTVAPDQPLPVKDTVQRRAQALSDCYTLARLAKSGVVPSGKPLSALLRLGRGSGSGGGGGGGDGTAASASRERAALEAQIKAQLRRAYFDSFRPLLRPGHNGGQRAAAWTRLAQDLVEAVVPLVPPRMSADPALYPSSAAAAAAGGHRTSSMRAAVERDLLLTASTTPQAAEEKEEEECLPRLERLVRVLQRLCAPARDPDVRAILDKLGAAIDPAPGTTPTTAAAAANTSGNSTSTATLRHAQQSAAALTSPSMTTTSQSPPQPHLEVVDLVREILDLAEAMRSDLDRFHTELKNQAVSSNNTTTTTLSEQELERVVEREAAMRERAVVLEWYGGKEENVRRATRRWCLERSAAAAGAAAAAVGRRGLSIPESSSAAADSTTLDRVVSREEFALALVETLFASQPVAVPSLEETPPLPPVERNNLLPPPLVVLAPLLFELQNQLQALVILACLATIVSSTVAVASPPPPVAAAADASALLEGLWTILDMNITRTRPAAKEERVVPGSDKTSAAADDDEEEAEEDGTRLAHLADEILAHLVATSQDRPPTERAADPDPQLAKRVRASVDRILRYEDPVWKLFSKRIEGAVKTALVDLTRSVAVTATEDQVQPQVPAHLRTGRSTGHRRFPLPPPPPRTGAKRRAAADLVAALQPIKVKGFDKPAFLADKVSELVSDRLVGEVWVHVEEVWGTILGWAE